MTKTMFDFFTTISVLFKQEQVVIDNNICRMHYKVTVVMLIVFSLLLTSRQYFGDPIDCISSKPGAAADNTAIETYCWIYSTFTVRKHLNGVVGRGTLVSGVGTSLPDDQVIYHKYYQWVCFMLCFQSILFYMPRYLWLYLEGGKMHFVTSELTDCPLVNSVWTKERKMTIVKYLTSWHLNQHSRYAIHFALCEYLNFVNVIGQVFLLDSFLGYQFISYSHDVLGSMLGEGDALSRVFPKLAKCTFSLFGPSGTIQNIDALCVLPLNIVNEKIFAFVWIWLIVLALVSLFAVLYRTAAIMDRKMRKRILLGRLQGTGWNGAGVIVYKLGYGDWFFLVQMSKNMNPIMFRELLEELVEVLRIEEIEEASNIISWGSENPKEDNHLDMG